jgi:uncharacterized protein (DUF58 family)
MALLEPAVLEALERLALATRTRMLGFFAGEHRSRRFGSSVDFADYREYRPGDDFRRIDAALSARLDRLFLKLFEAEEDVPVRIILDTSASMAQGSPPKSVLAAQIAAGFAHVSMVQADRARLYAASDGGAEASRWFRVKADSASAMEWLTGRTGSGGPGVRETIRGIREEGRPGVLILVSDLLDPAWEETIRRLAPPGEAAVVHVLAPDELSPSLEGDVTLVDVESGHEVEVSATADMLGAYARRLDAFLGGVRSACTSRGISFAFARSDDDVRDLFLRSFRREQVVR